MSYAEKHTVDVVTDAAGNAISYSPVLNGRLSAIHYFKDGTTPFAAGVDFAITNETTGQSLWSELNVDVSGVRAPRQATHGVDGVAALYAAVGEPVLDKIALANDRVKITIANGGATKTGRFIIILE